MAYFDDYNEFAFRSMEESLSNDREMYKRSNGKISGQLPWYGGHYP